MLRIREWKVFTMSLCVEPVWLEQQLCLHNTGTDLLICGTVINYFIKKVGNGKLYQGSDPCVIQSFEPF